MTPASDWYAVGVMLHEALAGRRPFQGPASAGLAGEASRRRQPAPGRPGHPGRPGRAVPPAPGPRPTRPPRRPRNRQEDRLPALNRPRSPPRAAAVPSLVGRGPHLAALEEGYRNVCRQGVPQTMFISGRSGEGKTTLGEHFLASLRRDKSRVVMAGRCYDRESVPFKALDSLIDALASYLKALPETDAALLMPDDIGVLAQVFPVLQRVGAVARVGNRPDRPARRTAGSQSGMPGLALLAGPDQPAVTGRLAHR